jgi:hypothetical protein
LKIHEKEKAMTRLIECCCCWAVAVAAAAAKYDDFYLYYLPTNHNNVYSDKFVPTFRKEKLLLSSA